MKTKTILDRVDTRLAACAVIAAGAGIAVEPAEGAIVWSGPVSINIPSTVDGIYLNVVTGVFSATAPGAPGWDVNLWNSATLNMFTSTSAGGNGVGLGGGAYVGSGTNYFNLSPGTPLGAFSTFAGTGTNTISAGTPLLLNTNNNFVGFRFINEAAGGQIQYGWMRISLAATSGAQPRMIVEYAYENIGAPIIIEPLLPSTPEPSTYALLGVVALGALGVRACRKRRTA